MKHGKVPTRNQKELMLKNNLNPKEWLVVKKWRMDLRLLIEKMKQIVNFCIVKVK